MAGGVGGYGVAAFEGAEGAALFELEAEAVEALAFGAEQAFGAGGQVGTALFEAQAQGGNLHTKIERDDAQVRSRETAARMLEVCAQALRQARGELVGALALLAEEIERAAKASAAGKLVDAAAQLEQAVAHEAG